MFKKVLVAEDMDSINQAVASTLDSLGLKVVHHAQYCDKAWIMAKKAIQENEPYDLLICDLSFKQDHRDEKISSGQQLIEKLKNEDPQLKVIVNSVEDHPQTVKDIWKTGNIEAYICKDRNGLKELKNAVSSIMNGTKYHSPVVEKALNANNLLELGDFEIFIVKSLAEGLTQDDIQTELKLRSIKPNSKSAIEKRLKYLKEEFNANTNPHLVGIMKDLRLI